MTHIKLISATAFVAAVTLAAVPLSAEPRAGQRAASRGGSTRAAAPARSGGVARPSPAVGQAVRRPPGVAPRIFYPSIVGRYPYRPYYYRPSFRIGIGYGYGYYPYSYYPYGYPYYGYGYGGYPLPPAGYVTAVPGRAYGGVRITEAPGDAEVYADGYYVGIVDDFDGAFQHVNLEAGPHRIEIRAPGAEPIAFDVRVEPGETITYRAPIRQ